MNDQKKSSVAFWMMVIAAVLIGLLPLAATFVWFWIRPLMREAGTWPLPW